ncbi:MAG: RNA polymerase sigma factor [Saprospiraceae bacterium]|nr:RNA polymerase sigma factor [Saprospiraceae bacterium]MCF8249076.1 RNA polymerase sigma factor [Saprospiraceae bacterium]MCF8280943.1 RNA polymerase sigma factor [Bacteroidales bacterium]MCF8311098.1 RNA polymerase sigma factor [Saprospiraceae bacterium]MCF8440188.1 RNA polymerase sigma factor [Saprospiraceae bacterium]
MSKFEFNNRFFELSPALNAFAYSLTQNMDDAKDLYQETAFRAMSNREKFMPGTNFKAWAFTIMKNIFINNYRKKVKANTIFDNTDNLYYLNSGSRLEENGGDTNILIKELKDLIENLHESIKLPFLMYYQGYKYQEIADHFKLPLGTIKSRIFFARRELKEQIRRRYHYVDEMLARA